MWHTVRAFIDEQQKKLRIIYSKTSSFSTELWIVFHKKKVHLNAVWHWQITTKLNLNNWFILLYLKNPSVSDNKQWEKLIQSRDWQSTHGKIVYVNLLQNYRFTTIT